MLSISCGSPPTLSEHQLEVTSVPSQVNSSQQRVAGSWEGASCLQHSPLVPSSTGAETSSQGHPRQSVEVDELKVSEPHPRALPAPRLPALSPPLWGASSNGQLSRPLLCLASVSAWAHPGTHPPPRLGAALTLWINLSPHLETMVANKSGGARLGRSRTSIRGDHAARLPVRVRRSPRAGLTPNARLGR